MWARIAGIRKEKEDAHESGASDHISNERYSFNLTIKHIN